MAEDFLEGLYSYADAITSMEILVEQHRSNTGTSNFKIKFSKYIQKFMDLSKQMISEDNIQGKELWDSIQKLYEYTSFVPLLDDIEEKCLPIARNYISNINQIDVDDGTLRFRTSKYGFIYLSDIDDASEPYNSRINPMKEAYYIAKNIYHPSKYKYVFLGAGLGYIQYQLYLLSEGNVDIQIFFHDIESYEYARLYGVIDWIPEKNLNIVIDDSINGFLESATDKCDEYYFYQPDLKKYSEEENAKINVYVKSKNTEYATRDIDNDNFYRNIRETGKFISEFDKTGINEKIIVVAGGPSVDNNIEFIKNAHDNGMSIICVGTVLKKLIDIGVIPDIVTVCDPFISVASQFLDLNIESFPLMMGLNTNWRVAKAYKGKKYLVPIEGIKNDALRYVLNKKEKMFPPITNVTTMAFNIAIYLGAKEIYLVGADYGFPGKMSHAKGTAYREKVDKPDIKLIKGVSGDIYSDNQMIAYREELEEYISNNSNVPVINMSKEGAIIKGSVSGKRE